MDLKKLRSLAKRGEGRASAEGSYELDAALLQTSAIIVAVM